jgi:hypothetical protein
MGLASLRLEIGILCDLLYSLLLFNANLGLDFLGLALSRSQRTGAEEAEAVEGGQQVGGA